MRTSWYSSQRRKLFRNALKTSKKDSFFPFLFRYIIRHLKAISRLFIYPPPTPSRSRQRHRNFYLWDCHTLIGLLCSNSLPACVSVVSLETSDAKYFLDPLLDKNGNFSSSITITTTVNLDLQLYCNWIIIIVVVVPPPSPPPPSFLSSRVRYFLPISNK